jgi:hypothetical protein
MLIVVRYNDIPEVDDLPEIPTGTLEALAKIFVKHNVQGLFGVGLIHSHCTLNDGEVMLSTHLQTPRAGCWNRATKMNGVDASRVRGHMFKLAGKGKLVAYKLEHAPVSDFGLDNTAFFEEFVEYVKSEGLADLLGLQTLGGIPRYGVELDFGDVGTVVVSEAGTKHGPVSHTTGWAFSIDEKGIVSCKGTTVHASTTRGPHKVFIDSKLVRNDNDLEKTLRGYGVWVGRATLPIFTLTDGLLVKPTRS